MVLDIEQNHLNTKGLREARQAESERIDLPKEISHE